MTKINKEEYQILKELDDKWKWIARDSKGDNGGNLFAYLEEPLKRYDVREWEWNCGIGILFIDTHQFQFIKWEDEGPYNIAELIEEYEYSALERHLNSFKELSKAIRTKESEGRKVKKDKLWAKNKVREELESWQNIEGGIDEDGIKYVLNIIDQLDEPEVLSQEWIDNNSINASHDGVTDEYVHVDDLKNLLVTKQELPVIPKYYVDLNEAAYVVKWDGDNQVNIYTHDIFGSDEFEFHLTEQEIKDYDERFWPFAEEVG